MKWYGRPATVGMPKLSVRASLADFVKPRLPEKRHDLARLQDRRLGHGLRHFDGLSPDEHAFESGVALFKKHFDHFLEIRTQLVKRLALAVRARKPRYPPNVQARVGVPLDDRCKVLHASSRPFRERYQNLDPRSSGRTFGSVSPTALTVSKASAGVRFCFITTESALSRYWVVPSADAV